jgi:hypothetical protein
MPFATDAERLLMLESRGMKFSIQVETKEGRQIELSAEDFAHASDIRHAWLHYHEARSAEFFRVLYDGSLNPITSKMD